MYHDSFMKPDRGNSRGYPPGKTSMAALQETSRRLPVVILSLLIVILFVVVQPVSGVVILEYFHQQGCINCEKTDSLVESLRTQYRDRVAVESIEIDDRAGVNLLISYGVTEIPIIVINRNKVLSFAEISPEKLADEIRLAESGAYPIPEKRKSLFDGNNFPSVLFFFILGLMTGLSPCLLGSLVVLIAAAGGAVAKGKAGTYYPLVFGTGILAAYLLAAAGILGAGIAFRPDTGSRLIINVIAGLIAIFVALLQLGLFSLPDRMKGRVSTLAFRFHTLPGIFLLGIVFAVLFAPCAIAPFLILIETLLLNTTIAPVTMILVFSAGILTPFIALTALHRSIPGERLLRYAGIVQKLGGLLLLGFGCWLIFSGMP